MLVLVEVYVFFLHDGQGGAKPYLYRLCLRPLSYHAGDSIHVIWCFLAHFCKVLCFCFWVFCLNSLSGNFVFDGIFALLVLFVGVSIILSSANLFVRWPISRCFFVVGFKNAKNQSLALLFAVLQRHCVRGVLVCALSSIQTSGNGGSMVVSAFFANLWCRRHDGCFSHPATLGSVVHYRSPSWIGFPACVADISLVESGKLASVHFCFALSNDIDWSDCKFFDADCLVAGAGTSSLDQ